MVIAIAAFILFTGLGAGWVSSSSAGGPLFSPAGDHTYMDLIQTIGSTYGLCQCPPSADSLDGKFMLALLPDLVAPGPLAASLVLFPAGVVLGVVSIFRWKLMWMAGVIAIASGLLWFAGYFLVAGQLSQQFPGMSVGFGPYQSGVGGAILVVGYVLSKKDKLDWPID